MYGEESFCSIAVEVIIGALKKGMDLVNGQYNRKPGSTWRVLAPLFMRS
jgi:hypothetical protein